MLRVVLIISVAWSVEPFSDDELENLCGAPALSYAFFACRQLCMQNKLQSDCEKSLSGRCKKQIVHIEYHC